MDFRFEAKVLYEFLFVPFLCKMPSYSLNVKLTITAAINRVNISLPIQTVGC
jgi:hypothetical protein